VAGCDETLVDGRCDHVARVSVSRAESRCRSSSVSVRR
jgi:hypothetical protein